MAYMIKERYYVVKGRASSSDLTACKPSSERFGGSRRFPKADRYVTIGNFRVRRSLAQTLVCSLSSAVACRLCCRLGCRLHRRSS